MVEAGRLGDRGGAARDPQLVRYVCHVAVDGTSDGLLVATRRTKAAVSHTV